MHLSQRLALLVLIGLPFHTIDAAPPSNDDSSSAISVGTTSSTSISGTLDEATSAAGEPDLSIFASFGDEPTVWYDWTAPAGAEWLRLDLSGVNISTILTVYSGGSTINQGYSRSENPNYLIVPVTPGSLYQLRVASWLIDLYSVATPDLDFTLTLQSVGTPTTAEDHVVHGRGYLGLGSLAGLSAAETEFSSALTLSPTHQEALFFRGLTRLLVLEAEPEFSQLLTDLGITSTGSIREGGLTIPLDVDGDPIPAAGANLNLIRTWVVDQLIPRLAAIRSDLDGVTDNAFLAQLGTNETALIGAQGSDYVLIDRGDVLALKATTHGLEAFFNLIFTYDLGVPLQSVITLEKSGELSAQKTMETFTSLLSFGSDDRRMKFATSLTAMRDSYLLASTVITARADHTNRLTEGLGTDPAGDTEIKDNLNLAVSSLSGEVDVQGTPVNLSRFLATTESLRDWLPDIEGDKALHETIPDPTFDGILPSATATEANNILYRLDRLAGMAGYAAEVGFLLDSHGLPSAPFDDADGDKRTNFDEWALLTNAMTPDMVFQTFESQELEPGQTDLTLTFIRPLSSLGREWPLVVAVSDNLTDWDRTETKVELIETVNNGDGLSETVTYRLTGVDPSAPAGRYFRIESVRQ